MSRYLLAGLGIVAAMFAAGCGSGGGSLGARRPGGSLAMTLRWPPRIARAIPSGTQSVRVVLRDGTEQIIGEPRIVQRPDDPQPGPAKVVIDSLPPGRILVEVTAHGLSDASDPPISSGFGSGEIVEGQRTVIPIEMNSTVALIEVTPPSLSIEINQKMQLSALAKDGQGNPLKGIGFQWRSTQPGIVTVHPFTGEIVGLSPGQADILVQEEGSATGGTGSPGATGPMGTVTVFVQSQG